MEEVSELASALLILAVPFLFGIVVGIEIKRRRPPSAYETFGKLMAVKMEAVNRDRIWVGGGCLISNTMELEYNGQRLEVVVRSKEGV